jgi:CheY-specific phosphatase CheX
MPTTKITQQLVDYASNVLMKKSFERTAEAFSKFLSRSATIESVKKMYEDPFPHGTDLKEELWCIASDLKGELRGSSYLVFTKADAMKLSKLHLGVQQNDTSEITEHMVLELANILTANFVTVLANELGVLSYAYVPKLSKMTKTELYAKIKADEIFMKLSQKYKVLFDIDGLDIQPVFNWAFDSKIKTYLVEWHEKQNVANSI